jgi:hypothetical protein
MRNVYFGCQAVVIAAALAASAAAASAQSPGPEPLSRPPRWDASAGVGLHYLRSRELDDRYDWWASKAQFRLQLGRYLTTHLKAELAVTAPLRYESSQYEQFPVAGVREPGYAITNRRLRTMTVTPAFTYQFLDNSYAHPFVSLGAQVGFFDEHRYREQTTYRVGAVTYAVPVIDTRRQFIRGRPLAAAGFKSYLSDRWFVRPEIGAAFSDHGVSHTGLRLDIGADF